ncbi:MAG: GTPase Era [Candidatus Aminicenantes bacterium]|nr:GTPase Era [Candidatus Aminicenantes bacterium]
MKVGYVALIGRPNVGKSTLLNKMLGQKVAITSDKPQTTRISILGIKTTQKGQIIFVDNPGIHKPLHNLNKRMMSFVYSALETSNLINLLIDATLKFGHGDQFVLETLKNISTPIFLLINKVDIVKKEKILLLIDKYKDLLNFKEIIPISALKGTNLDILEDLICDNLPEAQKIFSDDEISDQSQRFLLSEIVREKVLSHVKQELPFVTAVYMDRLEDEIEDSSPNALSGKKKQVQYISATIFVEKETHRRIVIGKHGRLIKTIGTQARQELEHILGTRIFLDLWVKVKEKWRDSPDVLDLIESQK